MSDTWTAGTPLRAELPLDPLEAFRLASFGIEYVPQYVPMTFDRHALKAAQFFQWPSADSGFRAVFYPGDKWDRP